MIRKPLLLAILITLILNFSAKAKEFVFTDEMGRKVKIPSSAAKRIISLAPSITEILFALGLNEEIEAVTNYCDYPETASKKPRGGLEVS